MPARPAAALTGALLLSVLYAGTAAAQLPTSDPTDSFVGFALVVPQSHVETDYLVPAEFRIIIKDLSRDSGSANELPGGGVPFTPVGHDVVLAVKESNPPLNESGWHLLMETYKPTYGGQDAEAIVRLTPTTLVQAQEVRVTIEGTYTGPNQHVENQTVTITARVNPYTKMDVRVLNPVQRAGQFEIVNYEIMITNHGVYPENFNVLADSDKPDVRVIPPNSMWLQPGKTRTENITLLTPYGKPYEIGRTAVINIIVQSDSGALVPQVATLQIRGPYIPTYWIPLLLVGLVAGAITITKAREQTAIRRLERGRARPVALTPRQAVLLAELKRTDPEAYKARKAQLDAVYAARRERYKTEHKERVARDREERGIATAEYKAERKRRAAEEKAKAKEERAARKAAFAQEKLDARETKRKEKELRKKQVLLAKARKKQARIDEKDAARAAKAQAKADALAAKEAKRAAKAARRQEKP